jgi:hypothetical protein
VARSGVRAGSVEFGSLVGAVIGIAVIMGLFSHFRRELYRYV